MTLIEKLKESSAFIRNRSGNEKTDIAIVLGSGLGDLANELEDALTIDYKDIPHFPVSTVPGHKGRLVIGNLDGRRVLCMQGRFHFYEGWSMQECVYPIQVFSVMEIGKLFLTNAAGCVNTTWHAGDLMLISDHIKLALESPLRGTNAEELGPRFFDMSSVWSASARASAMAAADKIGICLREGVYMYFTGPQFETPAEIRAARVLGADAVGMSTVPEAIAASHAGLETLGISCLTNMAAGIQKQKLNHQEVLETGDRVKASFSALVREIVRTWK